MVENLILLYILPNGSYRVPEKIREKAIFPRLTTGLLPVARLMRRGVCSLHQCSFQLRYALLHGGKPDLALHLAKWFLPSPRKNSGKGHFSEVDYWVASGGPANEARSLLASPVLFPASLRSAAWWKT